MIIQNDHSVTNLGGVLLYFIITLDGRQLVELLVKGLVWCCLFMGLEGLLECARFERCSRLQGLAPRLLISCRGLLELLELLESLVLLWVMKVLLKLI